jgi:hypothetical protein
MRTKADAGMPDNPYLITSGYHAFSQRGGDGGEMTVNADIPIVLNQNFQSARAAMLNAE